MLAAVDVHYNDQSSTAMAAAIGFNDWTDDRPASEHRALIANVAPYVPGSFFERELPCLLEVLSLIPNRLDAVVIDGYVTLGDRPGLGMRLWQAIDQKSAVVGVAKTRFRSAPAVEITRGGSRIPLFITCIGIELAHAAELVKNMHGEHRLPTLLKIVDRLARSV
jgi:deoxyribonuclease V